MGLPRQIAKHMAFMLRHAIAKPRYERTLIMDDQGWVSLKHMRNICNRLKKLDVTKEDLLAAASERDRNKKLRFATKDEPEGDISIRAFNGQPFGAIRTDQSLAYIDAP